MISWNEIGDVSVTVVTLWLNKFARGRWEGFQMEGRDGAAEKPFGPPIQHAWASVSRREGEGVRALPRPVSLRGHPKAAISDQPQFRPG